jgi:hypothetical protein
MCPRRLFARTYEVKFCICIKKYICTLINSHTTHTHTHARTYAHTHLICPRRLFARTYEIKLCICIENYTCTLINTYTHIHKHTQHHLMMKKSCTYVTSLSGKSGCTDASVAVDPIYAYSSI